MTGPILFRSRFLFFFPLKTMAFTISPDWISKDFLLSSLSLKTKTFLRRRCLSLIAHLPVLPQCRLWKLHSSTGTCAGISPEGIPGFHSQWVLPACISFPECQRGPFSGHRRKQSRSQYPWVCTSAEYARSRFRYCRQTHGYRLSKLTGYLQFPRRAEENTWSAAACLTDGESTKLKADRWFLTDYFKSRRFSVGELAPLSPIWHPVSLNLQRSRGNFWQQPLLLW